MKDLQLDSETEALSIEEWRTLSDEEKGEIVRKWSPYTKDIAHLVNAIMDEFRQRYGDIENLNIKGMGNKHSSNVIVVEYPFLFDKRQLPNSFLGIQLANAGGQIPDDFGIYKKYIWAPENYENYVDNHFEEIRVALGNPEMDRSDMLDALFGLMPFDEWIEYCKSKGLTKKYSDNPWWKFWK